MALPCDFVPVRLRHVDARHGRREARRLRAAQGKENNPFAWVGFAAEGSLVNAYRRQGHGFEAHLATSLRYDLWLEAPNRPFAVEVKTRANRWGWVHPEKFDWITVPMHEDREPIKADASLVLFCWWSGSDPRRLWIVGRLTPEQFQRRATFYSEGQPLPRGGWARDGGCYAVAIDRLDPVPRGLFKEFQP
jgi:hypothetical protein